MIVVVFDLDDTLVKEIEYLKSAYRYIAHYYQPTYAETVYETMLADYYMGKPVFQTLIQRNGLSCSVSDLLHTYRTHQPMLTLSTDTQHVLNMLQKYQIPVGLVTDGRSLTQRNKLKAVALEDYFFKVIISEEMGSTKPDLANFRAIETVQPAQTYWYVGDNVSKDFIGPNQLGWKTACLLNNGENIHTHQFQDYSIDFQPHHTVSTLSDLLPLWNLSS
jgi:putative hydrolase of the HAD superfamily